MSLVDEYAETLIRARQGGAPVAPPASDLPDRAEALEIQRRLLPHLGGVAGFKVGAHEPGAPILAPITAARLFQSGADVPAAPRQGIELEIGFELMSAPAPEMREAPQDFFRPRVVLELCRQRLAGEALPVMAKFADMQLNDGLVLGSVIEGWDGADFGEVNARLRCGDVTVVDGPVTIPGGSALTALRLLLDNLGDHCGGLEPGHVVITGSVSGLEWFAPGITVEASMEGLGAVSCRLTEG